MEAITSANHIAAQKSNTISLASILGCTGDKLNTSARALLLPLPAGHQLSSLTKRQPISIPAVAHSRASLTPLLGVIANKVSTTQAGAKSRTRGKLGVVGSTGKGVEGMRPRSCPKSFTIPLLLLSFRLLIQFSILTHMTHSQFKNKTQQPSQHHIT